MYHIPDPIPGDDQQHYKPFSNVYGTLTTEKDRPLSKKEGKKDNGIPFNPSAQTARSLILCCECLRPRVVYFQRRLSYLETSAISWTIEGFLYTCGTTLHGVEVQSRRDDPPTMSTLFQRVFVCENLTCEDPVEVPYYSCEAFPMIGVHCACPHESCSTGIQFVITAAKGGNCPSSIEIERFLVVYLTTNSVCVQCFGQVFCIETGSNCGSGHCSN